MMRSNFLNFAKMQVFALSQIVWLQLLCIVLYPLFFSQLNASNDLANVIIYATGLLGLSYLILRNFAFNDAKHKTKLLFSILPVTPRAIVGARGAIVYLFCLIATPLLVLFSNIIHMVKPEMFAAVPVHILPDGILLDNLSYPVRRCAMNMEKWLLCPVCSNKTRIRAHEDTVLENFPLFCPKCKHETIINVKQLNMSVIREPDAQTQSQ